VRFSTKQIASNKIATLVQDKLDNLAKLIPNFGTGENGSERPTLLILDRSVDNLAPILHEFTYQAMCNDLLPIYDGQYSYDYINNAGDKAKKTGIIV